MARHKGRVLIILLVASLFLAGCAIFPERAPAWDAKYQIPLGISKVAVDEILPQEVFRSDGDKYFIDETLGGSLTIGLENLDLEDFVKDATLSFPIVKLGNILPSPVGIAAVDVPAAVNGTTLDLGYVSFPGYSEVHLNGGSLALQAKNAGDAPIDFVLELKFAEKTVVIEVENLQPGMSQKIIKQLDDVVLNNQAHVTVKNPGVTGGTAKIDLAVTSLQIDSLESIKGHSATVSGLEVSDVFTFPDPDLDGVFVESGELFLEIASMDALSVDITDLSLNNIPLISLGPNRFSLAGREIAKGSQLSAKFDVTIDGSVLFTVPDNLILTTKVSNVDLKWVKLRGFRVNFAGTEILIQTPDIDLDEPLNELKLQGVQLNLWLEQELGALVYDDFYLDIVLNDSTEYILPIQRVEKDGFSDKLTFSNAKAGDLLNDILKGHLAKIRLGGEISSEGQVLVKRSSEIDYTLNAYMPLYLASNQSFEYADTFDFEILELSNEDKKLLAKALGSIKLRAEIDNALPLGLDTELILKDQNDQIITKLSAMVEPGMTNSEGIVTKTKKSIFDMDLSRAEIQDILDSQRIKIQTTISLNIPENGALLRPADFIKIRALLDFHVHFNKGDN